LFIFGDNFKINSFDKLHFRNKINASKAVELIAITSVYLLNLLKEASNENDTNH
tara:strand:- start:28 stop:189 length:162 start_codon:yes stop_codon:yes gene_type:complete